MADFSSSDKAFKPVAHHVASLSNEFLNTLIDELDNDDIAGISLGGSHARGIATKYSDVDLACFVLDSTKLRPKRFLYRDGHLVSIGTKSIADIRDDLLHPERAIWIASSFATPRTRRILLDKDGSVHQLMQDIENFNWEPLQAKADGYASFGLMLSIERAQKILSALAQGDMLGLAYAIAKLFSILTEIVAVQRGVMIKTDSTYYQQVEQTVGLDSAWTLYHRSIAIGDSEPLSTEAQGIACLRLYRETAHLLRPILRPAHRTVIEESLVVIDSSGLIH
jgi:Nucleotidyltransferase domain